MLGGTPIVRASKLFPRRHKANAYHVLFDEAERAGQERAPAEWVQRVERLSQACETSSKTHIAFLGTALLAKAVDLRADAFAIKAVPPPPCGPQNNRTRALAGTR